MILPKHKCMVSEECFPLILNMEFDAKAFQKKLHMIKPSMSLAGVESTVIQPSLTSHALLSPQEREAQGISDNLLRLSVGLENKEDILLTLNKL